MRAACTIRLRPTVVAAAVAAAFAIPAFAQEDDAASLDRPGGNVSVGVGWTARDAPRFGLYGSDPTTPALERTPKPVSISAMNQITTSNSLPTNLLELYIPAASTA